MTAVFPCMLAMQAFFQRSSGPERVFSQVAGGWPA
jgi:hypothetical protein